jgi:hypothetical protein
MCRHDMRSVVTYDKPAAVADLPGVSVADL